MSLLEVRQNFQPLHKHNHCTEGNTISYAHCLQDENKLLIVLQEKYHYPLQKKQYEHRAKKNTNHPPQLYQHGAIPIQISIFNKPQILRKNNRSNSKHLTWQFLKSQLPLFSSSFFTLPSSNTTTSETKDIYNSE